jgi:phosphoserine phosphatase
VGDDAIMIYLNLAGLGILSSTVKEKAESSISSLGLDGVLPYLLGYDEHDMVVGIK